MTKSTTIKKKKKKKSSRVLLSWVNISLSEFPCVQASLLYIWCQDCLLEDPPGPCAPPSSVTGWGAPGGAWPLTCGGAWSSHRWDLSSHCTPYSWTASCFLEGDLHGGQPSLPQRHWGSSQIDWCQLAMEALLSYSPSEPPTPLFSRLTHFLKLCSKYFTEKVWRGPTGLPNHEGGGLSREQRKGFKLCVSFCRVQPRLLPLVLSPRPC